MKNRRSLHKTIRRWKNLRTIIRSLQKHQDIYLRGVHSAVYGIGRFFKTK